MRKGCIGKGRKVRISDKCSNDPCTHKVTKCVTVTLKGIASGYGQQVKSMGSPRRNIIGKRVSGVKVDGGVLPRGSEVGPPFVDRKSLATMSNAGGVGGLQKW
jgi:hypothetical protein